MISIVYAIGWHQQLSSQKVARMSVTLNPETVRVFVSPTGSDDPLVRALYIKQHHRTLVSLSRLYKKLKAESPDLAERSGFAQAFDILSGYPQSIQKIVLEYPSMRFWLDVAWDLVRRESHIRFPEMHVQMHLEEFSRFALAAVVISESATFEATLWTDVNGHIPLPGTGLYLSTLNRIAYQKLRIRAHGATVTANPYDDNLEIDSVIKRYQIPTMSIGIELNAIDMDLRLPGRTDFTYEQMDREAEVNWLTTLEEAWEWINECSPLLAQEMLLGIKAFVPVESESADVHASATFQEAPGLVALSWTPDTSIMVEALVHEYHHQKLNALFNLDPVITGPSAKAVYYSPWRSDPRPLTGVLHAAYVFQAILEFWNRLFAADIPLLQKERVQQRAYLISRQLEKGLQTLIDHAEFSPIGEALLDAIVSNYRDQNAQLPNINPTVRQRLNEVITEHRQQWETENRHLVQNTPFTQSASVQAYQTSNANVLETGSTENQVLKWLQFGSSFNPVEMTYSRYPEDPLLHAIVDAQRDQDLSELEQIIRDTVPGNSLLVDLAVAHVSYVQSDYEKAAVFYESCVTHSAGNPYFWQCFAFTLRHLGQWSDADTIITNLGWLTSRSNGVSLPREDGKNSVEQRLDHMRHVLSTKPS